MGQVLACGAIIKSNVFARGTNEEKEKVVEMLINAGSRRTYLSLPAVTFLNQLMELVSRLLLFFLLSNVIYVIFFVSSWMKMSFKQYCCPP